MNTLVASLKAVADESRLRILRLLLQDQALNVGELVGVLGLSQPGVSQKLAELRRAGLVRERREGGFSFYELVRREGEPVFDLLAAELEHAEDPHGDLA